MTANQNWPEIQDQLDTLVSAQTPDPATYPTLYMLHGPCGAKCMVNGKCNKNFPKSFHDDTHFGEDGYPDYARPDNGHKITKENNVYDNCDGVPYNPYLSAKYNCHINVGLYLNICNQLYTQIHLQRS